MSNISFNPLAWAIRPLYEQAKSEDSTFAQLVRQKETRTEKPKSLDECADYILGEAFEWASNHRNGNVGFSGLPDSEMIRLIKHYYTEENITIKKVTAKASVATSAEPKKADAKKAEGKQKKATIVNMQTPASTGLFAKPKQEPAKKESNTFDLFAGMWNDEEDEKEVVDVDNLPADDDDLPL